MNLRYLVLIQFRIVLVPGTFFNETTKVVADCFNQLDEDLILIFF